MSVYFIGQVTANQSIYCPIIRVVGIFLIIRWVAMWTWEILYGCSNTTSFYDNTTDSQNTFQYLSNIFSGLRSIY